MKEKAGRPASNQRMITFAAVFILALAARLVFVAQVSDSPLFRFPVIDAETYNDHARALMETGKFRDGFFWQGFFYPLVLAGIYKIAGYSILAAKYFQFILGSVTAGLSYLLGARFLGRRPGIIAGVIIALYGPLIAFEGQLLATCWAAFWSVSLVLLFTLAKDTKRMSLLFLLGLTCGLSVITRATFAPFVVAALAWLILVMAGKGKAPSAITARAAVVAAGTLIVLIPVSLASLKSTGDLSPLPQSGSLNLYIGNNPRAEETIMIRPGMGWRELIREPQIHGAASNSEKKEYFSRLFFDYVKSNPGGYLAGLARKAVKFVSSRELPRNIDIYLFGKYSSFYSILTWKVWKFGFPFGLLLPLALVGLFTLRSKIPLPVPLFLALYSLSIIMVFVTSRYRVAVVPVLALPAAGALDSMISRARKADSKKAAAAVAAALVLALVFSLAGPFEVEKINYEAEMYCNTGFVLYRAGRLDEAVQYLAMALEADPHYSKASKYLGLTLSKMNHEEKAVEYFRRALRFEPDSYFLHYYLGVNLLELGRKEEALAHLKRALVLAEPFKEEFLIGNLRKLIERFGRGGPAPPTQ